MTTEPDDIENDVLDSLEIQDTIIEKLTFLEKTSSSTTVTTTTVPPPTPEVTAATGRTATASRLPKLDLPRYAGDLLGWQTFWDSFNAAVHTNPSLTGIEKFNSLSQE